MPLINDPQTEHQLQRWMRPDAHRYIRPDWRRFWNAGHENDPLYRFYESVERKFSPDQPRVPAGSSDGGQWTSDGGGAGGGPSPGSTRTEPTAGSGRNDPRVLSDVTPDNFSKPGTRLAANDQSSGYPANTPTILERAKQIAASGNASYQKCLDLCYPILERFKLPGRDFNTFDFHKCMNACFERNR
jgi:hypothetical protein